MLPCGIVKKLIRLICRDCRSGGEEGPGAICVSGGLWWMGWTDADLCLESITATDLLRKQHSSWHRETPTSRVLPLWCGGGDVRHKGSVIETTHSWWQTDPCLTLHHSWCIKLWISKGYEPVKEQKHLISKDSRWKTPASSEEYEKISSWSSSSTLPGSSVMMAIVDVACHYGKLASLKSDLTPWPFSYLAKLPFAPHRSSLFHHQPPAHQRLSGS